MEVTDVRGSILVKTRMGPFPPDEAKLPPEEIYIKPDDRSAVEFECDRCYGTGYTGGDRVDRVCRRCGGKGVIRGLRMIDVLDVLDGDLARASALVKQFAPRLVERFLLLIPRNRSTKNGGEAVVWTDPWGITLGLRDSRKPKVGDSGKILKRGLPVWGSFVQKTGEIALEGYKALGLALTRQGERVEGHLVYAAVEEGKGGPAVHDIGVVEGKTPKPEFEFSKGAEKILRPRIGDDGIVAAVLDRLIDAGIEQTRRPNGSFVFLPPR